MTEGDRSRLPVEREGSAGRPARIDERLLTPGEVDQVLRRATRSEDEMALNREQATTVGDLVAAAREVGLDADAVRRAASLEPVSAGGPLAPVTGAAARHAVRARMPGPLPEDRTALAVAAERAVGRAGAVEVDSPERFVWRESHGIGRTTVEWDAHDPRTLRISADRAGHYLGYWFGGLLGWAGLSSLFSVGLGPLATTLLFLVTPVILARPFWIRSGRNTQRQVEDLAMALLEATAPQDA